MYEAFFLLVILSLIYFVGSRYSQKLDKYHWKLMAFSAGIFITVLFMELLPMTLNASNPFILLLAGFVIFHLLQRYVYHHRGKTELRFMSRGFLDVAGFFVDGFLDGMLILLAFDINVDLAYTLFIPIFIHKLLSAIALSHIVTKLRKGVFFEILLSMSTILGGLLAFFLEIEIAHTYAMLAFITGTLTYIIIRDMIPREKYSHPLLFLSGVLLAALILFILP
jgi:zinc transporter ZupT